MKHIRRADYMIVGQGLVGSALAIQLLKRNKKILVIDQPFANSSSRVAAGLFNPITGRHMIKTWMADKLFPYFHTFYREAEALTKETFFYPLPLYRPFQSIEEQNEWMAKSADPIYEKYVEKIFTQSAFDGVKDNFGGLLLKYCGYLDTIQFLNSVRKFIETQGIMLTETFRDDLLHIEKDGVRYKEYEADQVVFCQGIQSNKWFSWVPVLPLKGETLQIKVDYEKKLVLNRGVYAIPSNQTGMWRVGATYTFTDKVQGITEAAREELTSKMKELISFDFEVIDQDWGIRPATHDRKPILGTHPEHKSLHIFNGMGPKGVSQAPYFSEILIDAIENDQPLDKPVDLKRYKLLYWTPSKRI
jgi:glycine oxidase